MRSIVRKDTGERYQEYIKHVTAVDAAVAAAADSSDGNDRDPPSAPRSVVDLNAAAATPEPSTVDKAPRKVTAEQAVRHGRKRKNPRVTTTGLRPPTARRRPAAKEGSARPRSVCAINPIAAALRPRTPPRRRSPFETQDCVENSRRPFSAQPLRSRPQRSGPAGHRPASPAPARTRASPARRCRGPPAS